MGGPPDREDGHELEGTAQGSGKRRDSGQRAVPGVQERRVAERTRRREGDIEAVAAEAPARGEDRAFFPVFRKRAATAQAGPGVEGSEKRTKASRTGEKKDRKRAATKSAGNGGAQKKAREEGEEGRGVPAVSREERDRTDKGSGTPRHDPG